MNQIDDLHFQRLLAQQLQGGQQQEQQGSQIDPQQLLDIYQQFGGGGLGGGASSGGSGGFGAISTPAMQASGSGGASAGGGLGQAAMSVGPWAGLAAAIGVNEYNAKKGGHRSENPWTYGRELATGKVLEQDLEKRWLPKVFGDDKTGLGNDMLAGVQLSRGNFGGFKDSIKESSLGKMLRKIF